MRFSEVDFYGFPEINFEASNLEEKLRRGKRYNTNIHHHRAIDVWERKYRKNKESEPLMLRRYHTLNKQRRLRWGRIFHPKEGRHYAIMEKDVIFSDAEIPIKITPQLERMMMELPTSISLYDQKIQPIYFLLEALPKKAIAILIQKGILEKEEHSRKNIKIEYSTLSGYWITGGNLKWGISYKIRYKDKPFIMSANLAKKIYNVCEDYPEAKRRLKMFGCYASALERVIEGDSAIATFLGVGQNDLQEAHLRFFNQRKNHIEEYVTFLSKRDVRERKHGGGKKPYSPGKHGGMQKVISSMPAPEENEYRKRGKIKSEKKDIPEHERIISGFESLYRTCIYIHTKCNRKAKAGYFKHHNPVINQALQIIFNYLQSRTDRGLYVDIDEFLSLGNQVVRYRLSKWEKETNNGIITIHHVLGGRFCDYKKTEESKAKGEERIVPIGNTIYVSNNYHRNPDRYAIDQQSLLSAVKRVLRGSMNVSDFHVLDPRTREILTYCQEVRELSNGQPTMQPVDIAYARVPELRVRLLEKRLLYDHREFVFR